MLTGDVDTFDFFFIRLFFCLVLACLRFCCSRVLIVFLHILNHGLLSFTVGAGTNKQHVITKNTAKLDRETEELKHDKIPMEVGKLIQQGRNAKGLSQKDLATVSIFYIHLIVSLEFLIIFLIIAMFFDRISRKSARNHKSSMIMKLAVAFPIT